MVYVFKQLFLIFKQYFTYFYVLFHPHVFSQMFSNNNFQFLNTYTKRALNYLKVALFILTLHFITHLALASMIFIFLATSFKYYYFYSSSSFSLSSSSSLSSLIQNKQTHKRANHHTHKRANHHTHNSCRDLPTQPPQPIA